MRTRIAPALRAGSLAVAAAVLLAPARAEAQESSTALLKRYLDRAGLTWTADEKEPDVLRVVKSTDLKSAESVEVIITNLSKESLVTLRTFSKVRGEYLSLAAARDPAGLARGLLKLNATAFGAYFVDEDGDIGFRYVFTTESGIGYDAFAVVINEMLRIGDEVVVPYYLTYR
jgi:hypothetical protein